MGRAVDLWLIAILRRRHRKLSDTNEFQVWSRHRRACPGGALTGQLHEPLAALFAPVGLVPTERMTVSLNFVAPVGTSPKESLSSARDVW
jgi:hypothetical protein